MEKIISDRFTVENVVVMRDIFGYPDNYWNTDDDKEKMIKELIETIGECSSYYHVVDRISGNYIPITDEGEAELLCSLLNELPESYLISYFGDSDVYTDNTLEEKFTVFKI